MKVQYIASACTVIEHGGVRVLTDPWLTDGVYYGSWCHNPPLDVAPEDFHDVDYIYLSHIHQDHTDLATLKRLRKDTPILIAPYADGVLGTMLRGRGFPVHVLPMGERLSLGPDFTIALYPADLCDPQACGQWIGCPLPNADPTKSYQIDSCAVFQGGGKVVANLNDCPIPLVNPALKRIRREYGPVDLLMKTYAGASCYPQCFPQLSEADMLAEAKVKEQKFIRWAYDCVDSLEARYWLPFAGQYTLAGRLAKLNRFRGVPELEELPDDPRMVRLNRGATWDVDRSEASEPYVMRDLAAMRRYADEVLSQRAFSYDDGPNADRREVVEAIAVWRGRMLSEQRTLRVNLTLRYGDSDIVLWGGGFDHSVMVKVDPRLLHQLIHRKAHWNAADVGSHLTFYREPNIYDRTVYWSLSHLHL